MEYGYFMEQHSGKVGGADSGVLIKGIQVVICSLLKPMMMMMMMMIILSMGSYM